MKKSLLFSVAASFTVAALVNPSHVAQAQTAPAPTAPTPLPTLPDLHATATATQLDPNTTTSLALIAQDPSNASRLSVRVTRSVPTKRRVPVSEPVVAPVAAPVPAAPVDPALVLEAPVPAPAIDPNNIPVPPTTIPAPPSTTIPKPAPAPVAAPAPTPAPEPQPEPAPQPEPEPAPAPEPEPAPAPAPSTARVAAPSSSDAAAVIAMVNDVRSQNGLAPVTPSPLLESAAAMHSLDQAQTNSLTHIGSDGSTWGDRASAVGYNWGTIGENVAAGYADPTDVMVGWMNSAPHRHNILSSNFTQIGVSSVAGAGYVYWTMELATPL